MIDVFVIIRLLETFQVFVGKLTRKGRLKTVFTVEYDFLTLQCPPYRQTVAQGFAHTGQQITQTDKRCEQMLVVHTVKRQSLHSDDKSQMAGLVINDVVCNVLADFRQKIRLRGLVFQRVAQKIADNHCVVSRIS